MLTDADKRFLLLGKRGKNGFHLATEWYLRGFKPLPYQWAWHHFPVVNTCFVAGIATGKTTIVAASNMIDCLTTPYFRALNTSVTAKQAELAFDMAMSWIEGNPRLEHHVHSISLRPYPAITFTNFSEYEFRTAGLNAKFIRGSEYDRINFDEAGLDFNGEIIKVLRGRLRGVRPDGHNTPRMARLDTTSSPTDAPWMIERFQKGDPKSPDYDPSMYRSLRVATWDNTALTLEQVEAMKAEYPPEMIDVEMGGMFPDYGFSMFPSSHVNACIDVSLYDLVYDATNPEDGEKPTQGYILNEDPRHGITHFEMQRKPGRIYIAGGDPGTDVYPKRNAAVVLVADVTEKPYKLVYFDWVSGKGSYNPFLRSYKHAIDKYDPILKGIDATGTQKGIDELAFENVGIKTDRINFTTDKSATLNSLIADITNHNWSFPPIKGLTRQLSSYTYEMDKKGEPQDIVMTMAELSYLVRFLPAQADKVTATTNNYYERRARPNASRRKRV